MTLDDRTIDEQRHAVVAEALTWIGTPYHHEGRVKGAGIDCAQYLLLVFQAVGLVPGDIPVPHYPRDWHMHRSEEIYLGVVEQYARAIEGPALPGDTIMYKVGRCFSHGAIVIAWPEIVHAYVRAGCVVRDSAETPLFQARESLIYRLKEWA